MFDRQSEAQTGHPSEATSEIRWGILGTGTIAKVYADALARSDGARLVGVATRGEPSPDHETRFPGARIVSGYESLLADPEIDAVYIATPHPSHVLWAIRAAEAGKHVVVEKPVGVNAAEAEAAFEAARKAGTFMMEAFMYRFHPQIATLLDLVRAKAIGEIGLIRASFGFAATPRPGHRLFADAHAGGGILDVGCYAMSMARLLAGAATDKPFADPSTVTGTAHLTETGADAVAIASLAFPGGILAQLSTSITLNQESTVTLFGSQGRIDVEAPWLAGGRDGGIARIRLTPKDGEAQVFEIDDPRHLYSHEIGAAGRAIRAGRQEVEAPGLSWADSLGNMRGLDAWREAVGLAYSFERPAAARPPLAGRPLGFARTRTMAQRRVPGLDRPVSVVALGTADIRTMTQEAAILDAYYEAGGNLFDTGWVYGMGRGDTLLGHWVESRGVRDEVAIIAKGAHTPLCYPDVISRQLDQSLDRLRTGHTDIYMMHRDNPKIPVGEFVDAIDREVAAGRVRSYGFSNWSLARFDEALAYAESHGKARPTSLSDNFSLAEMLAPVWAGCVAVSDDASKARLARGDIALYAWSSQARGFFTDRAHPDRRDNAELVASWYGERNFARKARAEEIARRTGRSAVQVALAYCLAQDFPVVPLIGPLTSGELDDSLKALDLALTPEDLRFLEA